MKTLSRLSLTVALLVGFAVSIAAPVAAQTTLNSTTLSAAVAGTLPGGVSAPQIVPLASVSNISTKDLLYVDGEFMYVTAIGTSSVTVQRGYSGTSATSHVSGAVVFTGARNRFYGNEASGACTAANETILPHIVIPSGNEYDCKNGEWVVVRKDGYRTPGYWGRSDGGTTYTAAGAITIQPGVTFINGTTLAMTLANPTIDQNGLVMFIISTNASAHTVTYTAGFGGGTTARDVATFGGAINDELAIVAYNGVWWVISTRNVTLG